MIVSAQIGPFRAWRAVFLHPLGLCFALLSAGTAPGLEENFDGWYEASYADHTYDHAGVGMWSLHNGLVRADDARSGNAVRFDDDAPAPHLDFTGLDGNGHDGGIGDVSFYYRHWDGDANSVRFRLQVNDGTGWVHAGPEVTVTGTSYLLHTVTLNDVRDNLKVRILSTAYAERLLIDDFQITAPVLSGVSITAPDVEGSEGEGSLEIRVELTGAVSTTAEILQVGGSAQAGLDYALSTTSVAVDAAAPVQVIQLALLDDDDREPVEDLVLQLVNVSGAPVVPGADTVTFTLRDNEPPLVYFGLSDDRVAETSGAYDVPVVLSSAADATVGVAVAGCATGGGVDYSLGSTQLVFSSSGSSTQHVQVLLVEDASPEGTEEIRFTIAATDGAEPAISYTFSLYVEDAEYATTTFTVMSANITSGTQQEYEAPGRRIFQALQPDVVGIQEFNVPSGQTRRSFVDQAFGTGYHFIVEGGNETIPNGVVSRWPITAHGEWNDPQVPNRDFSWATVDIPGPVDLHVVSVHLHSTGGASSRNIEAGILVSEITASFPATDYVVLCGDLNVDTRNESAVQTLETALSDAHQPADQDGDRDTNATRSKPYDFVLPNPALNAFHVAVELGGLTFSQGVVFDTREWTTPPAPALAGDSGASGMQHMAVMKRFTASVPPGEHTFDVSAGPGTAVPGGGGHLMAHDTVVAPMMNTPVVTEGATQYVCSGWTGTGSVPCEGEGTAVPSFPLKTDSTLTWIWETNYLLNASAVSGGAAAPPSQWVAAGATGSVDGVANPYFSLEGWTGDTDTSVASGITLDIHVDRPRAVEALFEPDLAIHDVPHWWLAAHGWTNEFNTHAAGDGDGDGEPTWAEYVSGHDPTNGSSYFAVTDIALDPPAGIRIETRPGRRYQVAFCDGLGEGAWPWSYYANPTAGVHDAAGSVPAEHTFHDTFDAVTSGSPPAAGHRAYRVSVGWIP